MIFLIYLLLNYLMSLCAWHAYSRIVGCK